jgi:hypothetical protein
MRQLILCCFLFLSFSNAHAMLVGNPAQPGLQTCGAFFKSPPWVSFRVGYLDDWVYQEKLHPAGNTSTPTSMQLSTYAGILTLNFQNRIDLYGIIGSSRLQLDQEIFTKRALGWGVGGKLIIFEHGNFFLGTDWKYFQTNQKPRFFVMDGLPYNIVSNCRLQYHEIQAAVGIAYRISVCAPYINATYLVSKLEPKPVKIFVRLPDEPEIGDTSLDRQELTEWGLALGLTLIDKARATLAVEWRAINQNAIDWNFEIRF